MRKKCDLLKVLLHISLILAFAGMVTAMVLVILTQFFGLPEVLNYVTVAFVLIGGIGGFIAGLLNIWR